MIYTNPIFSLFTPSCKPAEYYVCNNFVTFV